MLYFCHMQYCTTQLTLMIMSCNKHFGSQLWLSYRIKYLPAMWHFSTFLFLSFHPYLAIHINMGIQKDCFTKARHSNILLVLIIAQDEKPSIRAFRRQASQSWYGHSCLVRQWEALACGRPVRQMSLRKVTSEEVTYCIVVFIQNPYQTNRKTVYKDSNQVTVCCGYGCGCSLQTYQST